jgi:hypothetical protein
MRRAVTGLVATVVFAVCGTGWAQQRTAAPACDRAAASACTDQKVLACQNQFKGAQPATGQCQYQANLQCYQQHNCPTSAGQ